MNPVRQLPVIAASLLILLLTVEISVSRGQPRSPSKPPFSALAGSYYRGDGLGVNQTLRIEEDGSYDFVWSGCLGTYSRSTGRAFPRRGGLDLQTLSEGPRNRVPVVKGSFWPVRWGERQYLVPPDDLMGFVNAVNLGSEPRDDAYGMHYLRQDDWKLPVTGLPDLPEPYRGYLLKKPQEGSILRRDEEEGTFEVAFGLQGGILPGMKLVAEGEEAESFCEVEVVSVSGTVAVARAEDLGDCGFLHPGAPVFTSLASLPSPDASGAEQASPALRKSLLRCPAGSRNYAAADSDVVVEAVRGGRGRAVRAGYRHVDRQPGDPRVGVVDRARRGSGRAVPEIPRGRGDGGGGATCGGSADRVAEHRELTGGLQRSTSGRGVGAETLELGRRGLGGACSGDQHEDDEAWQDQLGHSDLLFRCTAEVSCRPSPGPQR